MDTLTALIDAAQRTNLNRRQLMTRAAMLGLSLPAVSAILAGCSISEDDDGDDDETEEARETSEPDGSAEATTPSGAQPPEGAAQTNRAQVGDINIAWQENGAGDPVLLFNMLGSNRGAWAFQIPALAQSFRTISFDNRDVGETGPSERAYTVRQLADDAVGLMDQLGIPDAHILAASFGGTVAQELAINYPQRVRSLTLSSTWPITIPWLSQVFLSWEDAFAVLGPVEWTRVSSLWTFTRRFFDDPGNVDNLRLLALAEQNPQTIEMYQRQSQAALAHDAIARLGQITAPTHVICGDQDILTPVAFSEEIAQAIPGAELSIVPGVGHGLFIESPEDFNTRVMEFMLTR